MVLLLFDRFLIAECEWAEEEDARRGAEGPWEASDSVEERDMSFPAFIVNSETSKG